MHKYRKNYSYINDCKQPCYSSYYTIGNLRLVGTTSLLACESYRKDEVLRNDLSNLRSRIMELFQAAEDLREKNIPFAVATIVSSRGSTPRSNAKMIIKSNEND